MKQSLLSAPDDIHTTYRRALAAVMTKDFLRSQAEHVREELQVLFDKLDRASDKELTVDLDVEIIRFTLDVIFRVTLSSHIQAQNGENQELVDAIKTILQGMYR